MPQVPASYPAGTSKILNPKGEPINKLSIVKYMEFLFFLKFNLFNRIYIG
jgi:hypothetical protein